MIRTRTTSLFEPGSVSAYGSEAWAAECRKKLQNAVSRAVGGRLEFDRDIRKFWELEGWKVLKNANGECFKTFREFAIARVPEGLQLTMNQFKAFMVDIQTAMIEVAAQAEVDIKEKAPGRPHRNSLYDNELSQGTSVDYLARRIARDRPDILERMKAGDYKSVRAAAKDAGIVKDKTPLQHVQTGWRHATLEDKRLIVGWIQDRLQEDQELLDTLGS